MGRIPLGFGTGDDAPVPPGGEWGSRYIDPRTRDYAVDQSTGQFQQMPAVRQRFLLRLTTLYGSSSVRPTDGVKLPRKFDEASRRNVDDAVRLAMRHETDIEKVARIDSVTLARNPDNHGLADIVVSFVDLTTGADDQVSF